MRVERSVSGHIIGVVLSKRNLLALLAKLDQPGSRRTIVRSGLGVTSEDDETHYGERTPGPMSPDTEARMEEIQNYALGG